MFIEQLTLQSFRNYVTRTVIFSTATTIIVGPNAQGKTSIIEAINLLATGNSFRAETVPEMIHFNQELARVTAVLEETEDDETHKNKLEVLLTKGLVQGKKTALRLYSVNDVRRRKKDFTSHFTTVVFRPEDMRLVEGSPSRRRNFIDVPLCLVDHEYERSLTTYEQALQRRNKLLHQIREGQQNRTVLSYWNLTLIKHGEYLTKVRRSLFDFFQTVDFPLHFSVEYLPSIISEARIAEYQDREVLVGHTLIGPHKDDFSVTLSMKELRKSTVSDVTLDETASSAHVPIATYGSRGQQRLAVLWLKMCEYAFLQTKTDQPPILLLDDILSELDQDSRQKVFELLGHGQTIVTTTEDRVIAEIEKRVSPVDVIKL